MKIVVCKSIIYSGDTLHALKVARAATQRGHKKMWSKGLTSFYWLSADLYHKGFGPYTILKWDGDDNEFLIFKLSETTGLVYAVVDVDETDELWEALIDLETAYDKIHNLVNDGTIDSTTYYNLCRNLHPIMSYGAGQYLEKLGVKF